MDMDVLRPARSCAVCITGQHFRYEVGRHCVTVLTCDPSGSDSPGRAFDQTVRLVGRSSCGGDWLVFLYGVIKEC